MTSIEDAARECARDLELFPLSSDVAPSVNESAALLALVAFARQQRKAALLEAAAECDVLTDKQVQAARPIVKKLGSDPAGLEETSAIKARRKFAEWLRTLAAREGE